MRPLLIIILLVSTVSCGTAKVEAPRGSGNKAHDALLSLSEREQSRALGQVVGEGCLGERAFYMGMESKERTAFWSVACANGESYMVGIYADEQGSTKSMPCSLVRTLGLTPCFQRFKNDSD